MTRLLLLAVVVFGAAAVIVVVVASGRDVGSKKESARTEDKAGSAVAVFAGGCFWCMEEAFDKVPGVVTTTSGFAGGTVPHPTYEQVSAGGTGHAEVVRVTYDPDRVSYAMLLDVFWHNVDPLDAGGQFCDRGDQYRSAIFYTSEKQRRLAERSKEKLADSAPLAAPIVTEIVPLEVFYRAETYHQDYHQKNPARYHFYKYLCGREQRLDALWNH